MPFSVGIDIGTTSTAGILIDDAGKILALASRAATLHSPHANWAEEDPDEWWENTGKVVRELMKCAAVSPDRITGVGVTGMLPAVLLVDEQGLSIRHSIQQNDARAVEELETFRQGMDEADHVDLTGTGYSQQLVGPKLMWLRAHEPEIIGRARHVMGASDYITSRLTSTFQVEHNWALESGFVNIATGGYDRRLIALSSTDPTLLPPIRKSQEQVGQIIPQAAAHLGIAAGTPVVAGCADHVASAFVCGASRNGDLVIKFGGAADILLSTDKPLKDRRLFIDHHIVPDLYFSNGCMAAGGNLLDWIIENCVKEKFLGKNTGLSVHQRLDSIAVSDTELLFLPYVLGEKTPLMDPYAKGTIIGLGLHHGIGAIWRAALEGIVFGMRHHTEVFAERELEITRVFAADGGAASDLWLQIAADVLELPVRRIASHPGSCLGAAFVAAIGTGTIKEWSQISTYVEEGPSFFPRKGESERYQHKYRLWRDSYEKLKPLYSQIHKLAN
jgi:xylulokinase